MSQLAIGMIETVGLAAGIEAADVCVKSANVTLIGYELSKGNGMTVVKIEGNVGAVNAAIEAATVAANKVSKVFSTKVIPRPSDEIDFLMRNSDTVGYTKEKVENEIVEENDNVDEEVNSEEINEQIDFEDEKEEHDAYINIDESTSIDYEEIIDYNEVIEENTDKESYTCNLCKDPKCPRQKGDLKTTCIHYEDDINK